ncbi:uncharacterized protein FTOL_02834 [Fusarium torulosum]|uniref:DUF7025 domain-containing protein n=1 Tax=Fusarium torulosum TaxID=33205 RepID=A0AAE8M2V4_9HYPO|nr:uncharacterized protein FTOL_02834 [Fusarium torulosum]
MDNKFQPGQFHPSRHPRGLVHQSLSQPQVFFSPDAEKDYSGTQHSLRTLEERVDVGMTLETRNLYRKSDRDPWKEWSPKDFDIDGKSSLSSAKYALIVRHEYQSSDNDESTLALRSITGINTSLRKLVFKAPFREFFSRWNRFIQADPSKDTQGTTEECSHFKLLADIIEAEIRPQIEQASDLLNNGVISFDYVWALFEPDVEVFSHVEGHERLFTLTSGRYSRLQDGTIAYLLTARYIDTDGDSFGSGATELVIWPFENVKSISELEAVPAHLQANSDEVRQ